MRNWPGYTAFVDKAVAAIELKSKTAALERGSARVATGLEYTKKTRDLLGHGGGRSRKKSTAQDYTR